MKHRIFFKVLAFCLCWSFSVGRIWAQERQFSINEKTGEINNCKLIKLIGKAKPTENTTNQVSIAIQKSLYKKIKKKGDDLFSMMTSDKKHFICFDDSHGGYLNALYFFDSKLKLVNKYIFEEIQILDVYFNDPETFLCISGPFNGDFYFFTPDGKLQNHGNFNELTGDKRTSYGKINISQDGSIYILPNNSTYIFDKNDQLISTINNFASSSCIDEENKNIYLALNKKLAIYNYRNKKVSYTCESKFESLRIKNKKIFLKLNNLSYEYSIN